MVLVTVIEVEQTHLKKPKKISVSNSQRGDSFYESIAILLGIDKETAFSLKIKNGEILTKYKEKVIGIEEGVILELTMNKNPNGRPKNVRRDEVVFNSAVEAKEFMILRENVPNHFFEAKKNDVHGLYFIVDIATGSMTFENESDYFKKIRKFGIFEGIDPKPRFEKQSKKFPPSQFKLILWTTITDEEAQVCGFTNSKTYIIAREIESFRYFSYSIGKYFAPGVQDRDLNKKAFDEGTDKFEFDLQYKEVLDLLKKSVAEDLKQSLDEDVSFEPNRKRKYKDEE